MGGPGVQTSRYSERYGARAPRLAGWPRAALYLAWRALFAAWRPVVFAALLAGAAVFTWRAGLEAQPVPAPADLSQHARERLGDPQAWWTQTLLAALNAEPGRAPDLQLAESLAPLLPELAGREHLARAVLLETRASARSLEAELRANPAWRRDRILEGALQQRFDSSEGAVVGLVFAPRETSVRLERARALYGPALASVEAWFADPSGRALALDQIPGLDDVPPRAVLYGDVRDTLVQGCALAEAAGRRIGPCRVGFLPKPPADPLLAGLALAVAETDGQARIGARVVKAAAAAGILDRGFATGLVLGDDETLAREAALAASMPLLAEAGERYTRPVYSSAEARSAGQEFARTLGVDTAARDRVFSRFAMIRRESGALAAVRTAGLVRSEADAQRLADLARTHGPALLGVNAALGPQMLTIDTVPAAAQTRLSERAVRRLSAAAALAGLAFGMLGWVLLAGWRRARGGGPGLVERADCAVTRLILGRNS